MSTPENPQAQETEKLATSDTFVLGHISQLIANLQTDGSDSSSVYRQLFSTINEHYRPLVSKIDLRDRASQYNDAYESPKLSGSSLIEIGSIAVSETLTEAICEESPVFRINSLDNSRRYVTIGIPVRNASQTETIGAISVALVPRNQSDINALVAELNSLVLAASGCIESVETEYQQSNTDWARVLTRVAKMGDSREFAFTLVNTLAERFDCGKVGLGMIRKRRVKLRAISGLATFKSNSPGVSDMLQAMEECYDRNDVVTGGRTVEESKNPMPIHRIWAEKTNSSAISLPMTLEDETLAIVTLQRSSEKPFTDKEVESLQNMLAPFGPPLMMIEKSGRTIAEHIRDDGRSAAKPWINPKSHTRKGLIAVAALAVLWFCFGSMTYRPVCESVLSPASINHMAVPFDARIETVNVSSGDLVKTGQVLLTLDQKTLVLERNQLMAEIQSAKVQVGQAVSQRSAPQAALANAQVSVLQAKLDSVNDKISQCTLTAPQDGIVIEASLRKRIGQTLPQGEQLLTFAPGNQWIVEVHVPDGVSPYIAPKQKGTFRSYSHPEQNFAFDIKTIAGSAEVLEGKNVFVAEASLESQATWMKAGMKGICRVDAVSKPVWWVALHGLLDRLQMRFWL